jgi:putative molybdopterin biosynthesis protein
MAQNKSLSTQEVADILHVSKSTIYDLIRKGEIHSYKIGRKVRFTQDDVDAYIARSRHEHSTRPVKNIDTHSTLLTPDKQDTPELIISGQDVVLDILANYLQQEGINTARTYLNSFEGLLSLYQDNIQVAACHLFDGFDYNTTFVRSLMPGVPAVLVNVSYRTQGFYVQKGNPKNIKGWLDLGREDITVLNRRVGSSARILMDTQLKRLGIPASKVKGYDKIFADTVIPYRQKAIKVPILLSSTRSPASTRQTMHPMASAIRLWGTDPPIPPWDRRANRNA